MANEEAESVSDGVTYGGPLSDSGPLAVVPGGRQPAFWLGSWGCCRIDDAHQPTGQPAKCVGFPKSAHGAFLASALWDRSTS